MVVFALSALILCVPADAATCKPVAAQPIVVATPVVTQQTIITLPVAPPYYYSVGHQDQVEKIADEVIKRFKKEFPQPESEPEADRELFKLFGKQRPTKPVADANIDRQVLNIFDNTCVKCHKPGASKPGNIQLLTEDRQLFVNPEPKKEAARRRRVYESVESGEMPKGLGPLTQEQKAFIERHGHPL